MTVRELTDADIQARVGNRHSGVGFEYPPLGLHPYYRWLINTLEHLAAASLPDLRVVRAAESPAAVEVAPGLSTLRGATLGHGGSVLDLSGFGAGVVHLWLEHHNGQTRVQAGPQAGGWPSTPHLQLAAVTLTDGAVAAIVDRRPVHLLNDIGSLPPAGLTLRGCLLQAAADADSPALSDQSGGTSGGGAIAAVVNADPSVIHAVATLAAYANALAADLNDLRAKLRASGALAT